MLLETGATVNSADIGHHLLTLRPGQQNTSACQRVICARPVHPRKRLLAKRNYPAQCLTRWTSHAVVVRVGGQTV